MDREWPPRANEGGEDPCDHVRRVQGGVRPRSWLGQADWDRRTRKHLCRDSASIPREEPFQAIPGRRGPNLDPYGPGLTPYIWQVLFGAYITFGAPLVAVLADRFNGLITFWGLLF